MCAAPEVEGWAREVALTLHIPCESCREDQGVDLAGHIWLATARLLRVPVHEISTSLLLMNSELRSEYALQHFTLFRLGERPLVAAGGVPGPALESWDLFMAIRMHTARVAADSSELQTLLEGDAAGIVETSGLSSIFVFESQHQSAEYVYTAQDMTPNFKMVGYDWNVMPWDVATTPAPLPPTTTSTFQQCHWSCRSWTIGDGTCDEACNSEACAFDGGDCGWPATAAPHVTYGLEAAYGTLADGSCACEDVWLGDGICDAFCNSEACGFDGGDCPVPAGFEAATTIPTELTPDAAREDALAAFANIAASPSPGVAPAPGSELESLASAIEAARVSMPPATPAPPPGTTGGSALALRGGISEPGISVVSLNVETSGDGGQGSDASSWRIAASEQTGQHHTWYVDLEEEQTMDSTVMLIVIFFAVLSLITACSLCILSRRMRPTRSSSSKVGNYSGIGPERRAPASEPREKEKEVKVHPEPSGWPGPRAAGHGSLGAERHRLSSEPPPPAAAHRRTSLEPDPPLAPAGDPFPAHPRASEPKTPEAGDPFAHRPSEPRTPKADGPTRDQRRDAEVHRAHAEAHARAQREREAQEAKEMQARAERERAEREARAKAEREADARGRAEWEAEVKRTKSEPSRPRHPPRGPSKGPGASPQSQYQQSKTQPQLFARQDKLEADSLLAGVMRRLDETRREPLEERRRVFKELQRQLHPDKNMDCQEAAKVAFQKLMDRRGIYLADIGK